MHGMLSLAVLVVALAALAGGAGWLAVWLYRDCAVTRGRPAAATGTVAGGQGTTEAAGRQEP